MGGMEKARKFESRRRLSEILKQSKMFLGGALQCIKVDTEAKDGGQQEG